MTSSDRVNILGVGVSAITLPIATTQIMEWVEARSRHYVCVTGVHGVMESRRSPEIKAIHNRASFVTPDGMPLVWLSRAAGYTSTERVYGPDLMLAVLAASVASGWGHYFYGGSTDTAARLAIAMTNRFPATRVAGWMAPPFSPIESLCTPAVAAEINAAAPDIVWVGLSTPKQERWMATMRPLLDAPVLIGVGAAFDFHTGRMAQAPRWMRRSGLEWLFRLSQEPGRLWKRYLLNNPLFVALIIGQRLGLRRYELPR